MALPLQTVLDLLEEHVYAGEMLPDGRYVSHLSPQRLARLLGGLLHDVGKVVIPDCILDKPGALDAAGWALMRTHPAVGQEIVGRFAPLREAAATVRHHHERYDGGGYPDGLAAGAIPIEARIVAAVDAYSAMTATRRYSAARTPAEAAEELHAGAGSHLDPEVVAALIDVLGPLVRPTPRAIRGAGPARR